MEYHHAPVPKSDYHTRLDTFSAQNLTAKAGDDKADTEPHADDSKIRYWSDYSRVYLHPRTIHKLPDLPDWETSEGDWVKGREEFEKLEEARTQALLVSYQANVLSRTWTSWKLL